MHPRRQRRRQVELHQDPLGRPPARRGAAARRRRGGALRARRATRARRGIATVYQDLAMVPLMSIWRNFFLGAEPLQGRRAAARGSTRRAREDGSCAPSCTRWGSTSATPTSRSGTLSGGERQSVAIARAVYFGARVLILDEPTSALGVKQAGVVLKYILQARERGVAVIFITHNPHHAYPVGDRFVILNRGQSLGHVREDRDRPAGARAADGRRQRAGRARARARGDSGRGLVVVKLATRPARPPSGCARSRAPRRRCRAARDASLRLRASAARRRARRAPCTRRTPPPSAVHSTPGGT